MLSADSQSLQAWGSGLPGILPSLRDPRRVDFSVSSAFDSSLGWSDDFQAPYMPIQKLLIF